MTIALTALIALPGSSPASTGGTGSGAVDDRRGLTAPVRSVAAPDNRRAAVPRDAALQAAVESDRPGRCPPNSRPAQGGCIPRSAGRVVAGERCRSARLATAHYRALTWARQEARGGELADRTPIVRSKTCRWSRFAAQEWQARARSARRALEQWVKTRTLRDFEVRPGNRAWRRAVAEAQRPYPQTASWLLSCSSTEGGWGRWVPNSQGFPPGGWLQFYESTFWRMWATAKADVRARGFRVPASAASWYSPLGQALAGAWGLTNGRRHEWNSSGC